MSGSSVLMERKIKGENNGTVKDGKKNLMEVENKGKLNQKETIKIKDSILDYGEI